MGGGRAHEDHGNAALREHGDEAAQVRVEPGVGDHHGNVVAARGEDLAHLTFVALVAGYLAPHGEQALAEHLRGKEVV